MYYLSYLHDSDIVNVNTIGAQDVIMLYNIEYSLNVCLSGCMLDLKNVSLLSAQYFKLVIVCLQKMWRNQRNWFNILFFCMMVEKKSNFLDGSDTVLPGSPLEITNALAKFDF